MNNAALDTVFFTVLSGVVTYVLGQLILKLLIEPVQDMKRTIGQVAHALVEHANVFGNPGVPTKEVMDETSKHLRRLSSELQSHLYLIPAYDLNARIFKLPARENVLKASSSLIGLSNSVHRPSGSVYEANAKRAEAIHDTLGIFIADADRWPKDGHDH